MARGSRLNPHSHRENPNSRESEWVSKKGRCSSGGRSGALSTGLPPEKQSITLSTVTLLRPVMQAELIHANGHSLFEGKTFMPGSNYAAYKYTPKTK